MLKQQFINPVWQSWLEQQQLTNFADWWDLELEAVDKGNTGRGGWSKVYPFQKKGKAFFIKKQCNYSCYDFSGWPIKVPTFIAEQRRIAWYARKQVPALTTVFCGWRFSAAGEEAVLVTEALDGYQSLEDILNSKTRLPMAEKLQLDYAVGDAIAVLHKAGIEHHNLYPKHVFVKQEQGTWQVRFIDLETSRRHFGFTRRKRRELETLGRRAIKASRSEKLRVLLRYYGKQRVDAEIRQCLRFMQVRSEKKQS